MKLVKTTKEEIQDLMDEEEVRMFEYFGNLDNRTMIIAKVPNGFFSGGCAALVIDTRSLNIHYSPIPYIEFMVCFREWYIHGKLVQVAFAPIGLDTDTTEFIMSGNAWDDLIGTENLIEEEGDTI